MATPDIIVYHNSRCGTSRNVIAMIKTMGHEPHIVEYLKTPPSVEMLLLLAVRADVNIRDFLRQKEAKYTTLGLEKTALSDEEIANIMHDNPELINRPIVVSPNGVKLCRPAETVSDLLVGLE